MKKLSREIFRVLLCVLLLIAAIYTNYLILYIFSFLIIAYDILTKAFKNLTKGRVLDENFLMCIATIGAFIISEYTEGIAVMLFYQIGELFQNYAVNKSRNSITELMDIRPDFANVIIDNKTIKYDPYDVKVNDIILIQPGERVPLDCEIIDGDTSLNTSALTGESLPKNVHVGDEILSGSININGTIKAKVIKEYSESTINKIIELVETATDKKSKAEHFITKFSKYYTPTVVIAAIILAVIPPLLLSQDFNIWMYRALSFLVVSCPCALAISIPLTFYGGIGGASKNGILIKGCNYIEVLSKTKLVIFDKTGTLTKGNFKVSSIHPYNISPDDFIHYVACAEHYSTHPISRSIISYYNKPIDQSLILECQEIAGHGTKALVNNKPVLVGNIKLMSLHNITVDSNINELGTIIYVAIDNKYSGYIAINDEIKEDSYKAIKSLKHHNINVAMFTGDSSIIAKNVAKELSIDDVRYELLPQEKLLITEEYLSNGNKTVFVGDGINDAPVLARVDVGIAMGGIGSDAAIEAADVVIMTDEPSLVSTAIELSKKTLRIVKQNIIFALGVKILVLLLTTIGYSNMWQAIFADVGVSIIAILNAIRMLTFKRK